ncbi:MAG TPA: hypothetical protein VF384_18600 [Planctomycetota bacterium]
MRFPLLLAFCLAALPLSAQDDVLAVERREDLRGRDAALTLLRTPRTDWHARAITPKDLCRLLTTATGDKVAFLFAAKGDAAKTPAFDLDLKSVTPLTTMAVVQHTTGLRFVWRSGVVFLVGKDEVRPLVHLVLYDLRAMCAPLKSFPGPKLGLDPAGGTEALFPPEEDSGTTVSGFTADLIERLIKENVTPEAWGTDTVSLTNQNGLFLVRQTPQGHREITRLLTQLGLLPLPVVRRPRR